MVRGGEIAEPVAEITIALNLIDMFATLEPASDLEFRRGIDAPTILMPEMTVGSGLEILGVARSVGRQAVESRSSGSGP